MNVTYKKKKDIRCEFQDDIFFCFLFIYLHSLRVVKEMNTLKVKVS